MATQMSPETLDSIFSEANYDMLPDHEYSVGADTLEGLRAVGIISPLDTTPEIITMAEQTRWSKGAFTLVAEGSAEESYKFANRYGINDTDSIANLVGAAIEKSMRFNGDFAASFRKTLSHIQGGFNLIAAHDESLYVARDRYGKSDPLYLSDTALGGIAVSSSQDMLLDDLGATADKVIEPGTYAQLSSRVCHFVRWAYPVHRGK